MFLKVTDISLKGKQSDLYINTDCIAFIERPTFSPKYIIKYPQVCTFACSKIGFVNKTWTYLAQPPEEIFSRICEYDKR